MTNGFPDALNLAVESWQAAGQNRDRKQLARRVGVTPAAVSFWTSGRNPITHPNAIVLFQVLAAGNTCPLHYENLYNAVSAYGKAFPDRRQVDLADIVVGGGPTAPGVTQIDANNWPGPVTLFSLGIGVGLVALCWLNDLKLSVVSMLAFSFVLATWFFEASLRSAPARSQTASYLRKAGFIDSYKRTLNTVLDETDRWIVPGQVAAPGRKIPLSYAWTSRLFASVLLLALIYPTFTMFIQWAIMGGDIVRRQGFWDSWRCELREGLAHLVHVITRRICGEASVAFRWSFV